MEDLMQVMSNSFSTGIGQNVYYGFWIVLSLAILGIIIFFLVRFMMYNIIVYVFEKTGSGNVMKKYKGGIFTKDNVSYLKLLGKKFRWSVPGREYFYMMKNKKFIFLSETAENMLTPVKLVCNSPASFVPLDADMRFWFVQEVKISGDKHKKLGFWEKYGNWVITLSCLAICFVLILFVLKYVNEMVSTAASATNSIKDAVIELGKQKMS